MVRSPKVSKQGGANGAWYEYYAMYSSSFVTDIIGKAGLSKGAVVLDPWSGTGTTCAICAAEGLQSTGVDANPAMLIVGLSRLATQEEIEDLIGTLRAYRPRASKGTLSNKALRPWFTEKASGDVDKLLRYLGSKCSPTKIGLIRRAIDAGRVDRISPKLSCVYVALFKFVREYLQQHKTTNPSWVKGPKSASRRISFSRTALVDGLIKALIRMKDFLPELLPAKPSFIIGDSQCLPIPSQSIDAVITSPPYCTRLDYIVACTVELAILGYDFERIELLRDQMIGTPTIVPSTGLPKVEIVEGMHLLLERIRSHPSKASSGYYFKQFKQYFVSISRSLQEISRVIKPGGYAAFVIQDSYYKDIHINLADLFNEVLLRNDWVAIERFDFECASLRMTHKYRSKYMRPKTSTESVITFSKI